MNNAFRPRRHQPSRRPTKSNLAILRAASFDSGVDVDGSVRTSSGTNLAGAGATNFRARLRLISSLMWSRS